MRIRRAVAAAGVWLMLGIGVVAVGGVGGCAAPAPSGLRIEPARYAEAFEAAKESLREFDFSLERVDAAGGVITTRAKPTAGLATPWDREQSTPGQEIEDLFDRQTRSARIVFEPPAGTPPPGAAGWTDLREAGVPVVMRATVQVSRRQRPGWRLETSAIRSSTRTSDPERVRAGMEPFHDVPAGDDALLAGRIIRAVAERLGMALDADAAGAQRTSVERRGGVVEPSGSPSSVLSAASETSGPR